MNYLEQLRMESAIREHREAFMERKKRSVNVINALASEHGAEYLEALDAFNARFGVTRRKRKAAVSFVVEGNHLKIG